MQQHKQVEQVIGQVIDLSRKYSADQVFLFGSWAKGTALERSDIDIAVSGVARFPELQEEIENLPTLFGVDIVDMDTCINALLLEDIGKYGKKIYEKGFSPIKLPWHRFQKPGKEI